MEILVYCLFGLIVLVPATHGLNLGLIPGHLRRTSPIIKQGIISLPQITSPILPRRLSAKPCTLKKRMKLLVKRSALKNRLLKIPRLRRIPKLPKLPLLPILPPIIPKLPLPLPLLPIIPPLPLLPPILPSVSKLLKPLRVPIIRGRLQKALGSEVMPVTIPAQDIKRRKNILQKLSNLKNRGTLTAAQIKRLKNVLL